MWSSMTYDRESEMKCHQRLTGNTGVDVYFVHPHAMERGISESPATSPTGIYPCPRFPRSSHRTRSTT
jgi:hypothetical protein